MRYAQTRAEERRIEKEKGIEFISPSEMPKKWKQLQEASREAKETGIHPDPEKINPDPITSTKGSILQKVKERGITLG
jgi:hypothetical protein